MRILIEEYQYAYDDVKDVIKGLVETHDSDGKVSLPYVGYYFNPSHEMCIRDRYKTACLSCPRCCSKESLVKKRYSGI